MPRNGITVLGIDAAWTDGQPSGVALVQRTGGGWRCLAVAASYHAFCDGPECVDRATLGPFDAANVLTRCSALGCEAPHVVAVDMPMSTQRIVGRRAADNEVSRRFGHCKCSAHSPNETRPGEVGRRLYAQFMRKDYRLVTALRAERRSLIEVYPHPALLGLTGAKERLPYKVSKRGKYWRGASPEVQRRSLVEEWRIILRELKKHIVGIELQLPEDPEAKSLADLKAIEDKLDALVCAWVGIQFWEGRAVPLGDASAAIWVPCSSMSFAKPDAA